MQPSNELRSPRGDGIVDEIIRMLEMGHRRGYGMERISHTEHAIQAAMLAEDEGRSQSFVVAALVHDIGHLLEPWPRDIAELGANHRHETLGCNWLSRGFGPEVTEPVRLHVSAKRYLCAVDDGYLDTLTPCSLRGLELQGGPMSSREVETFEREAFFDDALALRRIDERAKQPGLQLPSVADYRGWLESMLLYYARD